MPGWIAGKLAEKERPRLAAGEGVEFDTEWNIQKARFRCRELRARGGLPVEGERNDATFKLAAELKDYGLTPTTIVQVLQEEWNNHIDPPLDDDELDLIAYSAHKNSDNKAGSRAMPDPAVWAEYQENAPPPPGSDDEPTQGATQEPGRDGNEPTGGKLSFQDALERLGVKLDKAPGGYRPPPAPPLFLSAAALATGNFPPPEYLWNKFILSRDVNLLYGDGKTGKTTLALHVAIAVAAGLPHLFGERVTAQKPVLLVLAEDVKRSVLAICAELGVNLADLPITFCCRPRRDLCVAIVDDDGTWQPGPFLKTLCEQIAAIGECLVVLDPLATVATLNEHLRPPPHTLCQVVFDGLAYWFGATVLVTAHPSKAGMRDGSGTSGATSWRNAVRNLLLLTRDKSEKDRRELTVGGGSYGDDGVLRLAMNGPAFSKAAPKDTGAENDRKRTIRMMLAECGAYGFGSGMTESALAQKLAGKQPSEDQISELAEWRTRVLTERTALKNAHAKPLWRGLCGQQVPIGGTKMEWRWFLPLPPDPEPIPQTFD